MNSSHPTMPPRMRTVRVDPTSSGHGDVHSTPVMGIAHRLQESASAKTSNTRSGGAGTTSRTRTRQGAVAKNSVPTRVQSMRSGSVVVMPRTLGVRAGGSFCPAKERELCASRGTEPVS